MQLYETYAKTSIDITRKNGFDITPFYQPQGSIVADSQTGRILWEEDIDKRWHPASMSKLMTLALVLEKIQDGSLSMDKKVAVTKEDVRFSEHPLLSNNKMYNGTTYRVDELINLLLIPSSNVATRMLMQQVEPDMKQFVEMMNQKAKALKMNRTHFVNPFGAANDSIGKQYLPPGSKMTDDNISTSRDFAILAHYLINTFPYLTDFTKHATYISKPHTPYEERFHTYHHSLEGDVHEYKGTNGLKTGSSDKAAYNYTSTVKRENLGLIQVLMGVGHWDIDDSEYKRHVIGNALLDEVYKKYEYRQVISKGVHYINGQQYQVEAPLLDVVEKGQAVKFNIKNNQLFVSDGKRQYLTDEMKQPSVSVTPIKQSNEPFNTYTKIVLIGICMLLVLYIIYRQVKYK